MTLTWLDEGLATAIGNGIAYKDMTGHYYKKAWYDDPVIDTFARAIVGGVEGYLLSRAPADPMLLTTFERRFVYEFPDFKRRPEVLFPYQFTIAPDQASLQQFQAECLRNFALRGTMAGYPYSDEQLRTFNQSTPPGTRVLIVDNKAAAAEADKILSLKNPLAVKCLEMGTPLRGVTRSGWPIVCIPVVNGKLQMVLAKKDEYRRKDRTR
jgi:hypothetical protein